MLNISSHDGICVNYIDSRNEVSRLKTTLGSVPQRTLLGIPSARPSWESTSRQWFNTVAQNGGAGETIEEALTILKSTPPLGRPQSGQVDNFTPRVGASANNIWDQVLGSGASDETLDTLFALLSQDPSFTKSRT